MSPGFSPSFDDKDADLIIRTNDNKELRVFKLLLRKASPVFEEMFLTSDNLEDKRDTVPSVDVTEGSLTMTSVLQLCYPLPDPTFYEINEATFINAVCDKYKMEAAQIRLLGIVCRTFTPTEPFLVYGVACQFRARRDEARQAAFQCLSIPLDDIINSDHPIARNISMPAFKNLIQYYGKCRMAAGKALSDLSWFSGYSCWQRCRLGDTSTTSECPFGACLQYAQNRYSTRQWFLDIVNPLKQYLLHQATPTALQLSDHVRFPKNLPCRFCQTELAGDLHCFLNLLQSEIERRVKEVEFKADF
ncbi:hypothetical protein BDY19DRAFT_471219 [Irpex rosettiformis]|uniref:Uncharacterized protein n=1 Tax=Irpex rosettiformis TaxID=378272 RepID=A0ACB8TSA7_9APHY|nr:hypothetical protein BDY19DRAFT_471219 [Irpex rosettiformis]